MKVLHGLLTKASVSILPRGVHFNSTWSVHIGHMVQARIGVSIGHIVLDVRVLFHFHHRVSISIGAVVLACLVLVVVSVVHLRVALG